jgi:hypothetical protein
VTKVIYFGEENTGRKATASEKKSWVRVKVKTDVLGFMDYIFV